MPPHTIVLATSNPHKVEELRAIFESERVQEIQLLGLRDAADLVGLFLPGGPGLVEPAEAGSTFEQNATIKATSYAKQLGTACLADDSGIEIDALGGMPGVISSHYCTDGKETGMTREERDAANNARVLRELEGVSPDHRGARFVCVMVLALPGDQVIASSRGKFQGRIGIPPRVPSGNNGFGYDPLFLVAPEFARTGAQLPSVEKNARSHRAAAARLMAQEIRRLGPTLTARA